MKVVEADWAEMLPILAENQDIWGAGLSPQLYRYYSAQQFYKPWFKRNCHYYILKDKGLENRTVAGLKLYTLSLWEKGRQKSIAGIGAVYTLEAFRGQGYARKLVKEILSRCRKDEVSGVLLFSDIGTEFYESLNFKPLPALSYLIDIGTTDAETTDTETTNTAAINIKTPDLDTAKSEDSFNELAPLKGHHLDLLSRIYNRSKATKYSHAERSRHHWQYKLWREAFLQAHSKLDWPGISLLVSPDKEAYLLCEYAKKTLRILELVGKEESCLWLWRRTLEIAKSKDFSFIRSWQAGLPNGITRDKPQLRDWGHPMINVFDKDLVLPKLDHFPLLELDYF
jgi:predicted acetyltransferase